MYTAIVFLPLLGAIIAGFFGNRIGTKACELLTSGFLTISALLSWVAFYQVGLGDGETKVRLFQWISSGNFQADWSLRIDTLTVVMLVVVNTVSALVHWYSIGYMSHDPHRPRFFAYLSLFTFAMLMLVTADNFIQMFFGWEGVGLASYLLIGFWYQKPSANAAAIKAFVVNRIGDFGFALGIFATFLVFGSVEFDTVFANVGSLTEEQKSLHFLSWNLDTMTIICLLLFMGAMGKSAQFLLHTWLPDAMEGPTPVSALIHAATMVTAGVFMVARLSPMFEYSQTALLVVTFIGATTAFFAATVGLAQNDIKRVIAYSTCSQLGYMFVALGVGAYGIAIFHLFTHAFFKALLFLGSGSVIHAMSDEQDMRKMGGLRTLIPKTYWMMIIGTIALTGVPFITAGFYSKDAIIEAAYVSNNSAAFYAFVLTSLAALFTSFYSWRLIFMTFHGKSRADAEKLEHVHESPLIMLAPLYVLAVGALASGFVFKELFIGNSFHEFWNMALISLNNHKIVEDIHHVPLWVKWLATFMMLMGLLAAWYFYLKRPDLPAKAAKQHTVLYQFLLNKWYFDELYNVVFVKPAMALGSFFWKKGDGFVIDGFGPNGVAARVLDISRNVMRLQTGFIYHYAFAMLIGVAALITWFMFGGAG